METKWTPGPWGIGDGNEVYAVEAYRSVAMACWHAEGDANARLIAAAPDLAEALAALEAANEEVAAGRPQGAYLAMIDGGQSDALARLDDARRNARSALTRATGG